MGPCGWPVRIVLSLALVVVLCTAAHAAALGVVFTRPADGATVSDATGVAIGVEGSGGSDPDGDSIVQRRFVFEVNGATVSDTTNVYPLNHQESGFFWSLAGVADGPYLVEVTVFDEAGDSATNAITINVANGAVAHPVVWTSPVKVAVDGNTITKNAGCDGCSDAGAISQQTIASGNGAVAFTVSPNAYLTVGLSTENAGTGANEITFGLRFYPGNVVEVRESGVYKVDWTYPTGATHKIAVGAGVVTYYLNGALKYTSEQAPTAPLLLDTAVWTLGASVQNATITTASAGGTSDTTPPTVAITTPAGGTTVSGAAMVSATASDDVGVTSVHLNVDGVTVGEDTTAPYSIAWETTTATNGTHTLTAVATDTAGNTTTSAPVTVTVSNGGPGPGPGPQPVVWTSAVNATVSSNTVTKSGGCDGCFDAGAVSQQLISTGTGAVEFTTPANAFLVVGLSNGNPGTSGNEIKFGLRFYPGSPGIVEVRESGVYKWDWLNAAGAVHRIAMEAGVVKYYQNGVLKYTSATPPSLPLLVDTALGSTASAVQNAVVGP